MTEDVIWHFTSVFFAYIIESKTHIAVFCLKSFKFKYRLGGNMMTTGAAARIPYELLGTLAETPELSVLKSLPVRYA